MRALVIAQPTKQKQAESTLAWLMYQGSQHKLLRSGLETLWAAHGYRKLIDLCILSPFYGPLEPLQVLDPYDFGWSSRPKAEVAAWVRTTRIVERLQERMASYDMVFVLLSHTYLAPLAMREWVPDTAPQRWLYFISPESMKFLPRAANVRFVPAGVTQARQERVTALNLKSHLFRQLCLQAAEQGAAALEHAWQEARTT